MWTPEIARSLGRGMNEFRRASTELRESLTSPFEEGEDSAEAQAKAPAEMPEGGSSKEAAPTERTTETDDSKSDG